MTVDLILQHRKPDVYGQVHPVETKELVAAKLKEFDQLVAKLPVTSKKTRHVAAAQSKCPELLTDDFKLLFLRCDVFDCAAAVNRYCSYWKKRVGIFGEHRAFQHLTVDNMLPHDHAALHQGVISVIERGPSPTAEAQQEQQRRSYCFLRPCKMDKTKYSSVSLVRAMWYNIHAAMMDDENVQKQGLIFVDYAVGAKHSETDVVFTKLMLESFKGCMPVRFSAYHWCHPPSFVSNLWPLAAAFMGQRLRKRVRIHTGPPKKVLHSLKTDFGFQNDELPIELGGTYAIDVPGWLEKRRAAGK